MTMLVPAKQKYRRAHKGRIKARSKAGNILSYGFLGLKSLGMDRVSSRQIESARKAAVRSMKRVGSFQIRIFPDIPVSKKPAEVRMGKGKGPTDYYAVRVSPGRILFEIDGVSMDVGIRALELASAKLGVKTKIVRLYDE